MQREISISGLDNSAVSATPWSLTEEYDFAASLYSSILGENDLSDIGSSVSPSKESDSSITAYWSQIQQHQDLMSRYQTILSHLRDVARLAQDLRQENVNLKMANFDLKNHLNLLLNTTPYSGLDPGKKMFIGMEEEGTSENEGVGKSPTSVMDSGQAGGQRVNLPKSISVRSSGYLKADQTGRKNEDCSRAMNRDKIDNTRMQKVYVKGGNDEKKQDLELEVYNQGMIKTELCNKWQQTGACPCGQNCQFAHGIEELRPVLRHPRYKTEVCRMLLSGVPCPYGHRCHFRHALTNEDKLAPSLWAPQAS